MRRLARNRSRLRALPRIPGQSVVDLEGLETLLTCPCFRFYDIAWSLPTGDHADGVIATALENGSLQLYDAKKLVESAR